MIAYNEQWLYNRWVQSQADEAIRAHCITGAEKDAIDIGHPNGFYTPNIFVRIGLIILTVIITLFACGLLLLVFGSASDKGLGGLIVFFGVALYAGLEFIVTKKHYRSGVDDALIWLSPAGIITGLNFLGHVSWVENGIIICLLAGWLFIRFANAWMAAAAVMAFAATFFLEFIKLGPLARTTSPFVVMIIFGAIYYLSRRLLAIERWKNYQVGFLAMSITALAGVFAGGNYYVVREVSMSLMGLNVADGENIPLGWLFWMLTVLIPVLYIVRGVQLKDPVLLRVGLLLTATIVFTVRNYYHRIDIEQIMLAGGVLLLTGAIFLIRYLRPPKNGFTYEKEEDPFFMDKLHIESLIIAETFSGPATPAAGDTRFGGGTGGGAGASGTFE